MFFLINEKEGDILNTQDVTRSVIRLELARAFRGMESNPKRTLRKLADLGKVCARGSVQKKYSAFFSSVSDIKTVLIFLLCRISSEMYRQKI